jgi:uncharacterized membrane protein YdjX (TVP38/TMEM64 family)
MLALAVLVALIVAGVVACSAGGFTFEDFVRHRAEIDRFVTGHRWLAVLGFVALYAAAVSLSIPGGILLTVTGGFLFGVPLGAAASAVGATLGATVIFLLARGAIGEPLLRRLGPKAARLACGFRAQAFSYLLFLRLIPAFPFFLVNLVPALAGVRLLPFVAATAIGVVPAAVVYALAGRGLDSIIDMQLAAQARCIAAGGDACPLTFDPRDVLTPDIVAALAGLALLALLPAALRHFRRARTLRI